jgi:hypothetical protein
MNKEYLELIIVENFRGTEIGLILMIQKGEF